jgi:hypothetical protein
MRPEAIASFKIGPTSVTIYSTSVMPSAANSSSTTNSGASQRVGGLASLILVVSGGASCACTKRGLPFQTRPPVAVAAAPKRISRLVGNIGASRNPSPFTRTHGAVAEIFRDACLTLRFRRASCKRSFTSLILSANLIRQAAFGFRTPAVGAARRSEKGEGLTARHMNLLGNVKIRRRNVR